MKRGYPIRINPEIIRTGRPAGLTELGIAYRNLPEYKRWPDCDGCCTPTDPDLMVVRVRDGVVGQYCSRCRRRLGR